MNWYKKQLDKIADSCISNKTSDIRNLSEILKSDFQVHLSRKETKNILDKIANQEHTSYVDEIIMDLSPNIDSQNLSRLKDVLTKYSKL
jgi:hypothetical protein|tara:strand:- start:2932 stop:3198 length:267 start_codon:yes stop_codon:yes gene_type:complete